MLAAGLVRSYPWHPAQAAAFVLEGLMPRAAPFLLKFPQAPHPDRPRRAKVVMEIDLWLPANDVARAYRDLQRQVLPGHKRPVGQRSIDLVNFVTRLGPATWSQRLELWNNEHPEWAYSDYRRMRTAYARARASLLSPKYRLYLGPPA